VKASQSAKWIVAAAILANVTLGLWAWSTRASSHRTVEQSSSSLSRIILLGELTAAEQDRLQVTLASERARDRALQNFREIEVQAKPLPEGTCYIYSFQDRNQLQVFQQRVKSLASAAYIGERVDQTLGAVMLYIAPFPSFRQAQIELNELRVAGVDGFIIPDGDMANGISVGVFNSEENIRQRTDQLRSLGYALQRYQYTVDRVTYAVNVPVLSQLQIDDQLWSEILRDFPQMTSRQNSCWKVASTLNFN
jgi:SPOR domain